MKLFIEGADRDQATLFPERLDDYVSDDNPVRAIDAFVDALDLNSHLLPPNHKNRVSPPFSSMMAIQRCKAVYWET